MCGIAGVALHPEAARKVAQMLHWQRHRGQGEQGVAGAGTAAVGEGPVTAICKSTPSLTKLGAFRREAVMEDTSRRDFLKQAAAGASPFPSHLSRGLFTSEWFGNRALCRIGSIPF